MKGKVTFPFRVKCNGEYYAPGSMVTVDDVDEAVSQGAVLISEDKGDANSEKRTKTVKKEH